MKTETFHFELITPCFCGGAEPEKQAEIRAPSIRGQLRWWFRTLGGFKSLAARGISVRDQEALIFGTTAGKQGQAGKLIMRLTSPQPPSQPTNADDLRAGMDTPLGYALFPLRPFGGSDGKRGKIAEGAQVCVSVLWRGEANLWDSVRALLAIWGHLGWLGFRGRRAFGAVRLISPSLPLNNALSHFSAVKNVVVHELPVPNLCDWLKTAEKLLEWYRAWRRHGQMSRCWDKRGKIWHPIPASKQQQYRAQPGFRYARRDHNEGLDVQGTGAPDPDPEQPRGKKGETFRPALGLPIIQFFSSLGTKNGPLPRTKATVDWDWEWNYKEQKGEGRFASPVILRPYKDAQGNWHALVIFVDAHRWPEGKEVHLSCGGRHETRRVSLELYEAMKNDPRLKPFI
ncbi:MAG: type III-B CRISPR module RAMP protein Cmr1 [Verrucomicrobiota bacterium]|nr:type III-B CRISPR module RAMP protein Cmr1 [Verrucomicrobiota bacterium]